MIPSSVALPVVFGERPLALPSERRQVVGREPRSEQRSEEQPGYSEGSRAHLHHHRARISVTPHPDIRVTATLLTVIQGMDTHPTPPPGYGYPGYSGAPGYSGPPTYGYQGDAGYPAHPGPPAFEYNGDAGYPAYPPSYEQQGNGAYPPSSGSPGYGDPRGLGEAPLPPPPGYEYHNPPSSSPYSLPDYRSSAIS